jgi:hypothetical protein
MNILVDATYLYLPCAARYKADNGGGLVILIPRKQLGVFNMASVR